MTHVVMIVDDDRDIRDSLVELLQDRGYHAIGAGNGHEALELLRVSVVLPSLILLDLMMPVMDGWSFREEQMKHPRWRDIPVIVISAYRDVDAQARALELDHLRKPLGVRPLIEVVQRYCPGR